MSRISRLLLILTIIIAGACSPSGPELPLWLDGEWKTNNTSGFMGENWRLENDTLLLGQGMVHVADKISVMEETCIFISKGLMYYGAKVSDQNKGRQILFMASYIEPGHVVFENPGHDFPTRIVYKLKEDNVLEINISGRDEEDSRTFVLYRK